jgi:glycosyltransferase involved in cell wall biosynthesis
MHLLTIITPTYNEVNNINELSLLIKNVCEFNKINYEQIIIDNNSNDGTIEVIRGLTSKYKNIKEELQALISNLDENVRKQILFELLTSKINTK